MEVDNAATQTADVDMRDDPALPALPASATLYVRNLSSRRSRTRLLNDLHALFVRYRPLDVLVPHRGGIRTRGQAWIVFPDLRAAERALKDLQGCTLARKPMLLQYARLPSDATVRAEIASASAEGGAKGGDGADATKKLKEHRRERHIVRQEQTRRFYEQRPACRQGKRGKGKLGTIPATGADGKDIAMSSNSHQSATQQPQAQAQQQQERKPARAKVIAGGDSNPPHKVLFVQNLPEEATPDVLQAVFGRHAGFVEVRTVPGRAGIAFVEYDRDEDAARAREATAGIALAGAQLRVTFGKKT